MRSMPQVSCRRRQQTLAIALGVADHIWSIAELMDAACSITPGLERIVSRRVRPPARSAASPVA